MKKLVYMLVISITFLVISCSTAPSEEPETKTSAQIFLTYRMLTREETPPPTGVNFAELVIGDKLPIAMTINSADEIAYDFTGLGLKDEHTDGYLLDVHYFTDNNDGTIPIQTIKVKGSNKTWTVATDYDQYATPDQVSTTWGRFVLSSNANLYKQTVSSGMPPSEGSIEIADATANPIKRVTVHLHYNKDLPDDFVQLQGQINDGTGELEVVGTNKNGIKDGEGEADLYSSAP